MARMGAVHDLEEKLSLAPRRPLAPNPKARAKAKTPKNPDGDNVARLHFDSIEKALTFVTSCLEPDASSR